MRISSDLCLLGRIVLGCVALLGAVGCAPRPETSFGPASTSGPPVVSEESLFRPSIKTTKGWNGMGTAFPVHIPGEEALLVLTAHHVVDPSPEGAPRISGARLARMVETIHLNEVDTPWMSHGYTPSIPALVSSDDFRDATGAGDVMGFWVPDNRNMEPRVLSPILPRRGDTVWIAGRPGRGAGAVADTMVRRATVDGVRDRYLLYTLDEPIIMNGVSGGPVFNAWGEVVGVHVCGWNERDGKPTGRSCATPVARFAPYLEEILKHPVLIDRPDERTTQARQMCERGDDCTQHFWTLAFLEAQERKQELARLCHTKEIGAACGHLARVLRKRDPWLSRPPAPTLIAAKKHEKPLSEEAARALAERREAARRHDEEVLSYEMRACRAGWFEGCSDAYAHARVMKRPKEAFEAIRHHCDAGEDPHACYLSGLMLRKGEGTAADVKRAEAMLTALCYDARRDEACGSLAWWYFTRSVPAPDDEAFLRAWAQACELGQTPACALLGGYLTIAHDSRFHDAARGVPLLKGACAKGDPRACHWLGNAHLRASRAPEAHEAFKRACLELENTNACLALALAIQGGRLKPSTPEELPRAVWLARRGYVKNCEGGARGAAFACMAWAAMLEERLLQPDSPDQVERLRARSCERAPNPMCSSERPALALLNAVKTFVLFEPAAAP